MLYIICVIIIAVNDRPILFNDKLKHQLNFKIDHESCILYFSKNYKLNIMYLKLYTIFLKIFKYINSLSLSKLNFKLKLIH